MTQVLSPWEYAAREFETKPRRWPTPGAMAVDLDTGVRQSSVLLAVDDELAAAGEGRTARLAILMPVQEGKSQRASRWFPLWLLAHDPTLRIGITSYEYRKAERWGKAIRQDLIAHSDRLGLELRADSRAAGQWHTRQGGGVVCAGVGSALTGEPLDCLHGDSGITTERGLVSIRELHQSAGPLPRVLSLNHDSGRPEWRSIVASRAIADRPLVEVVTAAGRRFTCTPDHRIHTADGYRPASLLRPGDRVTVGWSDSAPGVRVVRQGAEVAEPDMPAVLCRSAGLNVHGADLLAMPAAVPEDAGRTREGGAQVPRRVLLDGLPQRLDAEAGQAVPAVRAADRIERPEAAVLLAGVSPNRPGAQADETVLALWRAVRPPAEPAGVLPAGLRGRGTFATNDRSGQLALQDGHELRRVVPAHAAADQATRRWSLPSLRAPGSAACPPPERATPGQPAGELDHAVPVMPCGAPQVGADTVSVVRHLHGERDTVYDLQVEGNRNFFAGEVLVHNCLVIDDPVKGRKEAESALQREDTWAWWEGTAERRLSSRLTADGVVVLICTRWHTDDLAGRLLDRQRGLWRVLSIPAIAESPSDPLGRVPGQEMPSAVGRPPGYFHALADRLTPYAFRALYQQAPTSAAGNLFRRDRWRYWTWKRWPDLVSLDGQDRDLRDCFRFVTADLAASTKTSADWTVGAAWALTMDRLLICLGRVRDRVTETGHWPLIRPLAAEWQAPDVGVESTMMGTLLVRQATRAGLKPFDLHADKDKITRAQPAAFMVNQGQVFLPDGADWLDEAISECADFPSSAYDDWVDVLAYAARVAHGWTPSQSPATPQESRPDPAEHAMAVALGDGHGPDDLRWI